MPKKYEVEDVKTEHRGILSPKTRVTSRDSDGKVAVGEWEDTEAAAQRSARERLSDEKPAKK